MMKSRTSLAAAGLLVTLFAAGDALANCSGKWPLRWKMPISPSHYGDTMKQVLSQNGFYRAGSVRNSDKRLSFAKTPSGEPGIRMQVKKGENKIVSFDTQPFKGSGADKACISVDVYFSSGFNWGTAGTKVGVGLWGGDTDNKNSGGVPPQLQKGWSIRVVNSDRGARAYSYHLNRDGKQTTEARCRPYRCEYGDTMGSYVRMRPGAWNNIQIEVQMNKIGSANGSMAMWVNGKQVISKSGILWRKSASWGVKGLKFTDMWGGNTAAKRNFSPRAQEMYYRNIELYGTGSSGGSSGGDPGGGFTSNSVKVSGDFAPLFPSSGAKVKPFSRISWKSHGDADRYFVRIIDRKTRRSKISGSYQAYKINCFGANMLCEIPFNASLSAGEHRMILRAVRDGKKLREYSFDFQVSSSGQAYSSGNSKFVSESDQSGSSSGSSSSGGAVVAQSPSGSVNDKTPTLRWSGGDFDKYYLKVVNDSKKVVFAGNVSPSRAGCASGSNCAFTLPSVRADDYVWFVRGVRDGRKSSYSSLNLQVR